MMVDSFSKWVEVKAVRSASAAETVEALREMFATHRLPDVLISDNGTALTSDTFKRFVVANSIRYVKAPPYHLASNG